MRSFASGDDAGEHELAVGREQVVELVLGQLLQFRRR